MIKHLTQSLRKFHSREDGSTTVEFALLLPLFLMPLFSSVELGIIALRQTMLERAMDITVREIRLTTGDAPQHDEIRDRICDRALFVSDCTSSLRLEMVQFDPFIWTDIDPVPDCVDSIENVQPVREFVNGQSNELMYMRACMKFTPIFPTWGLGSGLIKDEEGHASLFASSVFVQEPS